MSQYLIQGGIPLKGELTLPGAKNAVTKILIASLLSPEPSTLKNIPNIKEIDLTLKLLKSFGAHIEKTGNGVFQSCRGSDFTNEIPDEEASHNRMAVLTIAPLLHVFGELRLPKGMGGDKIGPRPIDFHLNAYKKLGAVVVEDEEHYHISSSGLRGANIQLPYPSVSTTENILLAASLAKGTTVIENAAIEPEVIDLVLFLQKMGAVIELKTNRTLVIEGQDKLRGTEHTILPDRIACASYGIMSIATGGEVEIIDAKQEHMLSFLNTLSRMKAPFRINDRGIIFGNGKKNALSPISLETDVHPGFMTDWQPPMVILMTQAQGMSTLHETVYENRLGFAHTLNDMGANIQLNTRCLGGTPCRFHYRDFEHSCIVNGPTHLHGTKVRVPDIRAGFTYVVAGLLADGETVIDHIEEIERGYGQLDQTLLKLGAKIQRID
jgi:UDP-N-acetylglucosamine 1-carboxyvinyltransferase